MRQDTGATMPATVCAQTILEKGIMCLDMGREISRSSAVTLASLTLAW